MKKLVINADDFNLSPAVSRGIHELLRDGCITSTSCLVYSSPPEVPADIRDRIGVHLRLTDGTPSLRKHLVPSLVNAEGRFPRDRGGPDVRWDRIDPEHAQREWERQITLFLEATGGRCTHLDSHHHMHAASDEIFDVYLGLCTKYQLRGVPLNPHHLKCFSDAKVRSANATIPVPMFRNERILTVELWAVPPDTTTWAWCHPGYVDEQLRQRSTMTGRREQELEFLKGAQLRKSLTDAGIRLIGACDL